MEMEDIIEKVIMVVKETLDRDDVEPDSLMVDDLNIESLEFYELLGNLESAFHIKVPEKILSNVDTVEDIAIAVQRIMEK